MGRFVDLTGERFGRLTVLKRAKKNLQGKPAWICKCDCGTVKVINGSSLREGRTRSCGCLRDETSREIGLRYCQDWSGEHNPKWRGGAVPFPVAAQATLPTNTIDETGSRFGNLTVLKYVDDYRPGAYWLCRCDCGGEVVTSGCNLRNGLRTSCDNCRHGGAGQNIVDETGNVHGELEVIERASPPETVRKDTSSAYWRCRCSCGNEDFIVKGSALRSGNAWHCGCLRHELLSEAHKGNTNRRDSLPVRLAVFNRLYRRYQGSAKRNNRTFDLTKEDLSFITKMNCFYCGDEPNQVICSKHSPAEYYYNGLDRINPSKGYTLDNVVPSCKVCNYMKRDYQLTPFLWHVSKITNYRRLSQ